MMTAWQRDTHESHRRTMQWTTATLAGSAASQFSMEVHILKRRPSGGAGKPGKRTCEVTPRAQRDGAPALAAPISGTHFDDLVVEQRVVVCLLRQVPDHEVAIVPFPQQPRDRFHVIP